MKAFFKSAYLAFDQFPSFKGAATHIYHMVEALNAHLGETLLITLPPKKSAAENEAPMPLVRGHIKVEIDELNFLKRAALFSSEVNQLLKAHSELEIIHFRDIWGGLAAVKQDGVASVFEVNSLPSIELLYRYPLLSEETIAKIEKLENYCLKRCTSIICPSNVIKQMLIDKGIAAAKIQLIPNGAELPVPGIGKNELPLLPAKYILYFGALQPWQGIDVLLKSVKYLDDYKELKIVICASNEEKYLRPVKKLADKLSITNQIVWLHQLDKETLHHVITQSLFTVAPLIECSRNVVQGCSPLKIFESMAAGTTVVASDLPVVREIVTNNENGKLFRPGRPADMARIMRYLLENPELCKKMGLNGQQTIKEKYTWNSISKQIKKHYQAVLTSKINH